MLHCFMLCRGTPYCMKVFSGYMICLWVWVISHYAIACFCIMPYHVVLHRISVSSISGLLAGILFTTTADLLHRQHLHLFILICV